MPKLLLYCLLIIFFTLGIENSTFGKIFLNKIIDYQTCRKTCYLPIKNVGNDETVWDLYFFYQEQDAYLCKNESDQWNFCIEVKNIIYYSLDYYCGFNCLRFITRDEDGSYLYWRFSRQSDFSWHKLCLSLSHGEFVTLFQESFMASTRNDFQPYESFLCYEKTISLTLSHWGKKCSIKTLHGNHSFFGESSGIYYEDNILTTLAKDQKHAVPQFLEPYNQKDLKQHQKNCSSVKTLEDFYFISEQDCIIEAEIVAENDLFVCQKITGDSRIILKLYKNDNQCLTYINSIYLESLTDSDIIQFSGDWSVLFITSNYLHHILVYNKMCNEWKQTTTEFLDNCDCITDFQTSHDGKTFLIIKQNSSDASLSIASIYERDKDSKGAYARYKEKFSKVKPFTQCNLSLDGKSLQMHFNKKKKSIRYKKYNGGWRKKYF